MLKESRVIGYILYYFVNIKNRIGIVIYFILKFINRGLVEVCGNVVNRGGGFGMEISCVYIFDGFRKYMDLF